jgi:hypothetical protein
MGPYTAKAITNAKQGTGFHQIFNREALNTFIFFIGNILGRRHIKFFFKKFGKEFWVIESNFIGNLRHRHATFFQQLSSPFQPDGTDKLERRPAGKRMDLSCNKKINFTC